VAVEGFRSMEDVEEELGAILSVARVLVPGDTGRGQAPPHDGNDAEGTHALFTYPLLIDEGRISEGADELKAALEDQAFVEVHPDDAQRLRIADGEPAQLRTDAGQAILPVRVSDGIAPGSCFVPFNNPGLQADTVVSGRFITT